MHDAKHSSHSSTHVHYESPSSRYMTIGRTRIHYNAEGRGPPVVLLHGVLGSLHSWDGWVELLAPHYRLIRIDLPGYGLSDQLPSDDYTPEHGVELLEQIREHLHLERFSLVGSSLGGFLSWYYAAHHPERIERLVLIDPIGYPQRLPRLIAWLALPLCGELTQLLAPRWMIERNLRMVYGSLEQVSPEVRARHRRLLERSTNRAAMLRTFRRLRVYRNDFDVCRKIPRVRSPTLLMWGERDRCVPLSLLDVWRRDLPTAQVRTYSEAGHLPMEELPALTAQHAHAFLSGSDVQLLPAPLLEHGQAAVPFVFARGA